MKQGVNVFLKIYVDIQLFRTIYWKTIYFPLNCCGTMAFWFPCSIYFPLYNATFLIIVAW